MEIRIINRGGWCHYCSGHKICGNTQRRCIYNGRFKCAKV